MLAKGKQILLLIGLPPYYSYIHTVKSGKSLSRDKGKKSSTSKLKDPLSFEILISCNGQPDCDDDRIIFVAMTST